MNAAQIAADALDRFGEYTATWFEGRGYTNFDQVRQACRLAAVLRDEGVQPGDRVVVMMHSCPAVPAAFQAVQRIGGVIIPIMPHFIPREVRYIVSDSGAKLVLTSAELAAKVAEATSGLPGFQKVLTFGPAASAGCEDIEPRLASAAPWEQVLDRRPNDLAVLVYTSGTTGNPKGVMLSHENIISNTQAVANLFATDVRHRALMVLPMSHVYGILLMNLGAMLGTESVLLRWFDAKQVLQTIQDFKVERCSLVPTMLVNLLACPEREQYDVSSLERVAAGSAPLSDELRRRFEQAFGCRVADGYGQSEATCAVTAYRDDEPHVVGSCGRPLPGIDVCIQDDQRRVLPAGRTGEICIRGPNVMQGYWNNPQATRETIVDGWLHSGDIGHMDERGYISITDRKKDLVIKGGENISPREIEEALARLPGVAEVAVFGVPDAQFQEELAAAIVLRAGATLTADDVRAHAAREVMKFKVPKYVQFQEQLPKNSNGKVLKRALRDEWRPPEAGLTVNPSQSQRGRGGEGERGR